MLARLVKPRPLAVIEESGSAFATLGARCQILSDVCRFGYTASELGAFSFVVWEGSFSTLVRGVRSGRTGWSTSKSKTSSRGRNE